MCEAQQKYIYNMVQGVVMHSFQCCIYVASIAAAVHAHVCARVLVYRIYSNTCWWSNGYEILMPPSLNHS